MQEAKFSDRYKGFLGLLAVLTVLSLLVMNDFTTIQTEEAFNILHVQNQLSESTKKSLAPFPNTSQFVLYKVFGFSTFWMRLSNVIVFLLLLLGIRMWGGKVFGKKQIITYIILIVSSFMMISLSKFAVADIPLCAFHMMTWLFLVICLKQPKIKWQIVYGLFVMGSFLVQPTQAVIYGLGLLFYLVIFHKNGANLRQPIIVGVWLFFVGLFFWLGGFNWSTNGFVFCYNSSWGEYFSWQLIGLLPWIGFLPAALWDLFQKLRKKEEMAIILFGWLLFSLISHSVILQLCLLFLMAKQVELYFHPNYPYKNLVKTFSIINLVVAFFVLIGVMLGGFAALHGSGFRAAAVFSAIYWMFGVIAIIGLFSDNRRFIIGGMGLAGAFSLLLFWVQINPIVNRFRDINTQLLSKVTRSSEVSVSPELLERKQFQVYGQALDLKLKPFRQPEASIDYYLLVEEDYSKLLQQNINTITVVDTLRGRVHVFSKPENFFVVSTSD